MKHTLILISVLSLFTFHQSNAQCLATGGLITSYASNNGQRGCMFSITASNLVTITCFDASLYAGTTADYEIYYKNGTFVGFETDGASWTLIGSASGVTSAGQDLPTYLPIPINIAIATGQTVSFYVTNTFGGGLSYTDGAANNTLIASDANIAVNGGVGKGYPFAVNYNFREFNGTVHYNLGNPLPVSLSEFFATPVSNTVRLNWKTNSEKNSDYFEVKRSIDGFSWLPIATLSAAGNSSEITVYDFLDDKPYLGKNYYKLIQVDMNGDSTEFPIRSVDLSKLEQFSDRIYPNPSQEKINIRGSKDDFSQLDITDFYGRNVEGLISFCLTSNGIECDVSKLANGVYLFHLSDETIKVIKN